MPGTEKKKWERKPYRPDRIYEVREHRKYSEYIKNNPERIRAHGQSWAVSNTIHAPYIRCPNSANNFILDIHSQHFTHNPFWFWAYICCKLIEEPFSENQWKRRSKRKRDNANFILNITIKNFRVGSWCYFLFYIIYILCYIKKQFFTNK